MKRKPNHLSAEALQALLDGRTSAREVRAVEAHLAVCDRCRASASEWITLFDQLGGMERKTPTPRFAEHVMARVDMELVAGPVAHPQPERLAAFAESALAAAAERELRDHLTTCPACSSEVSRWRQLFEQLGTLEHFEAPVGFAEAVLARSPVRGRTPVRALVGALRGRMNGTSGLLPRTRRAWAAVAGIATAPVAAFALVIWVLVSNPLVTPTAVASFLRWKLVDGLTAAAASGFDVLSHSVAGFRAYAVVELLSQSPAAAAAAASLFAVLTLSALWVLYRNLLSNPNPRRAYARASI